MRTTVKRTNWLLIAPNWSSLQRKLTLNLDAIIQKIILRKSEWNKSTSPWRCVWTVIVKMTIDFAFILKWNVGPKQTTRLRCDLFSVPISHQSSTEMLSNFFFLSLFYLAKKVKLLRRKHFDRQSGSCCWRPEGKVDDQSLKCIGW